MTLTRDEQPRMIPNPLWCETCDGRGYLVGDAEWEPYAVQCHDCKDRRTAHAQSKTFPVANVGNGEPGANASEGVTVGETTTNYAQSAAPLVRLQARRQGQLEWTDIYAAQFDGFRKFGGYEFRAIDPEAAEQIGADYQGLYARQADFQEENSKPSREGLSITNEDRSYALSILEDLADPDERDTPEQIVAQWICKVRTECSRGGINFGSQEGNGS